MRDADTTVRVSATADAASVRAARLGLVLRRLRDHGPRSRSRLASELGLTRAATAGLVGELEEHGLVQRGEQRQQGVGRPGAMVEVSGPSLVGLGAEVNVDHIAAIALDLAGRVAAEGRRGIDGRRLPTEAVLDALAELVTEIYTDATASGAHAIGLTIGAAGLVEASSGRLANAPNLGWHDLDLATAVRDRLGTADDPALSRLPVRVQNEAGLATIAEIEPTDPDRAEMVVLFGEVGLGGGVVSGGRLVLGRHGWAGEIGHLQLDPHGRRCGCGRTGCWETVVGLRALFAAATDPDDPVRDPDRTLEERLDYLAQRARSGDTRTLAALHQVGTWLGAGAAMLANVLNPGTIVLGGYFATLGEWLVPTVEERLRADVLAPDCGGTRVVASTLGPTAAVRGGALVSLETVLRDPTGVVGRFAAPATDDGGAR